MNGFAGQLPANSGGTDVTTGILDAPAGLVTATAAEGDDTAAVDLVLIFGIAGAATILVLVVIVVILIIVIVAMLVAKKSSTASVDGGVVGDFQSDGKAGSIHRSDTVRMGALASTPVFDAGAAQSLEMAEVRNDGV
jgi:hypothetical protein